MWRSHWCHIAGGVVRLGFWNGGGGGGGKYGIYRGRSRVFLDYFGGCGEHWGRLGWA